MKSRYCEDAVRLATLTAMIIPPGEVEMMEGLGCEAPHITAYVGKVRGALLYTCRAADLLDNAELWLQHDHEDDQD